MKDFLITAFGTALLVLALVLSMLYGAAAMSRAYQPEPDHDAYRAEQYHQYLVRKGYLYE